MARNQKIIPFAGRSLEFFNVGRICTLWALICCKWVETLSSKKFSDDYKNKAVKGHFKEGIHSKSIAKK